MAKSQRGQQDAALGPWSGVNNVQPARASVFQPGDAPAALRAAVNVDLTDDGWPRSRWPLMDVSALTSGLGAWGVGGRLFFQDGAALYERTTTDVARVTGLVARVALVEHWGQIYLTDGTTHKVIDGTTVRNWGLPVPTLSGVTQTAGTLYAPGRYLVQAAFVDARGNEGGVSPPVAIALTAGTGSEARPAQDGGIALTAGGSTADVTGVNVYLSEANQPTPSFAAYFAIGSPITLTSSATIGDPPRTTGLRGPLSGANGVASFRGFLLLWRGSVVFRSEAAEPHLFDPLAIMRFPDTVTGVAGLDAGAWIATAGGLWWIAGESPAQWIPARKTGSAVMPGSLVVPGSCLPKLQTAGRIALFVTGEGLVAGMPDGSINALTQDRYRFADGDRASFCYAERGDLRQILIAIAGAP